MTENSMQLTEHQERSREALYDQNTQEQLHTKIMFYRIFHLIKSQAYKLGIWQVQNYLDAKADKERGGEGLVHSVTFDN